MTLADDLEDLLVKEREAILQGRMKELQALEGRKLALLNALRDAPDASTEQLERLMSNAHRNSSLLTAAGRGIKAALKQITDAKLQKQQAVYGPNGELKPMLPRREQLEQKL